MRLGINDLAIQHRILRPFNMGDEIAVRSPGDHRHLDAGFAQGGQGFGQFKLTSGAGTIEYLDRTGSRGCRGRGSRG